MTIPSVSIDVLLPEEDQVAAEVAEDEDIPSFSATAASARVEPPMAQHDDFSFIGDKPSSRRLGDSIAV
jgi:hypothetical protein